MCIWVALILFRHSEAHPACSNTSFHKFSETRLRLIWCDLLRQGVPSDNILRTWWLTTANIYCFKCRQDNQVYQTNSRQTHLWNGARNIVLNLLIVLYNGTCGELSQAKLRSRYASKWNGSFQEQKDSQNALQEAWVFSGGMEIMWPLVKRERL